MQRAPILRVVLDTCILKLATLPGETNYAALVVDLVLKEKLRACASPAMLAEYSQVLAGADEFLATLCSRMEPCFPLTELNVIRHEPDNRFIECALVAGADFILTVNTAPGHFDQSDYGGIRVVTPGRFIRLPEVQTLLRSIP